MEAIGHILPIALAAALSSVPIMVTIYILLSPDRRRSALPFALGWVLGMLIVVSACALAAQLVPEPRIARRPETTLGAIEVLVGAALVVLGIVSLRRARRRADPAGGMLRLDRRFGPWRSFGLALLLNIRPKAVLLAIAAGLTIRGDSGSLSEALVVIGVYTVIGASTVLVPIVATLVAPARMEPRLTSSRDWLTRNGEAMTSLIVIMVGVVVVGDGLARFSA